MKKAEQIVIDATDKEEGGHYQNLVDAVREAQREAWEERGRADAIAVERLRINIHAQAPYVAGTAVAAFGAAKDAISKLPLPKELEPDNGS